MSFRTHASRSCTYPAVISVKIALKSLTSAEVIIKRKKGKDIELLLIYCRIVK